jgi:Family of unknown function (DUF6152)
MRQNVMMAVAAAAVSVSALPAVAAHHSFAAVFDRERPIELTGTVTKLEWANPHVWFYIDVANDGRIENWGFEMGSPSGLIRRGWNHNSLQVGHVVTVAGVRARDGSLTGAVRTVKLSTGQSLFGAQITQ